MHETTAQSTTARFLRTADAARFLGVSAKTLNNWRWMGGGRGPAFLRAGRAIRYDVRALEAWAAEHTHDSTSTADAGIPLRAAA
ncbi:helix-turn-helix transcriptional regulator [Gemmatimonas sp.]|uniref:helix-turn-helix transcriptional regulator n=1 Tax=Gemmatimonas sp. TaxID=1962908 RepID=UPI003DA474B8